MPRLSHLRRFNKTLADAFLQEIEFLQWSAVNESFLSLFGLLEAKFVGEKSFSPAEHDALCLFFEYFRAQWGPGSHVFR